MKNVITPKGLLCLLLVGFWLLLPHSVSAQRYNVAYNNTGIEQVMNDLRKKTGYEFVYQKQIIRDVKPITCRMENSSLSELLNRIFADQARLDYEIVGKTIILNQQKRDLRFFRKQISGVILDENGETLPGANIVVAGTRTGTVSDMEGRFLLNVEGRDPVLHISYMGMKEQDIRVRSIKGNQLTVKLYSDASLMQEVLVTGYQSISKERATGSFDIVDRKQLERPAGNIATRLIGSAAGLAGTQDIYGNPTFEIRGTSSFSVASAPLLVVDGFAVEGGFESINPNDVESVTVLKDAAAASIWGAKSANGVIVVTTKSGKANGINAKKTVVSVDYTGFYKTSPKMDLDYALSRISSSDLIDYEKSTFNKWGADLWYPEENSQYAGGSSVYNLLNEHRLGHISENEMNAAIERFRNIDNTDQIRKYVLQNPMVLQQNIGINIQTERATTAISVLYQNNHDHWKGNADNKYMVSLRNRTSLYKWLDLNVNGSFDYTHQKLNGMNGLPYLTSYENLKDADGNLLRYWQVSESYLKRDVPMEKFPYQDWSKNPLDDVYNSDNKAARLNARIQLGLTFKIWKGLTFDSKVQYELIDRHTDNYSNEDSYTVRDLLNSTSTWDKATDAVTVNLPKGGFLDRSRAKYSVLTVRNQLNFNQTFAERHTVALIAGLETTDRHYQYFGYPRTYGYNDETLSVGTLPGKGTVTNWEGYSVNLYSSSYYGASTFTDTTDRYFSAFGNLSYTYDNKYTLSGSYRTDASNLITDDPSYRYAPFWSVGASWQIGKESFMKEIRWIDKLNVRLTYGYNGNVDKTTTFKPLLTTSSTPNVVTGEYTGSITSYGNPTLRWEKTGTWDFGVDFDLLGHRLYGKIDLYNKMSEDLIASREISAVNGTTSMKLNNGKIRNRGVELEVGSALNITPDIAWTGTLTLSYNKNTVEALKVSQHYGYQLVNGGSSAWVEGEDMNTLWCYEYAGLINTGSEGSPHYAPSVYYENGEKVGFNTYLYGDGTTYCLNMGTKVAPWNASLSSTFQIYDFDFSFLLTGKFGHKFMRESYNYPAPTGGRIAPNSKYYEIVNCDPAVYCPQPQQDDENRYYFWDRFYPYFSYLAESASHIRVQEISLAYNLPTNIINKLGMRGAQVFVQTNNPFNIYFNSYGEDPEYPKGGYRLQASYTFGVKLHF